MTKQQANYSIPANGIYLLKHIWQERKALFGFLFTEAAIGSVLPLYMVLLPRIAVDLATDGASTERVLWVLGGAALLFVVLQTISSTCAQAKQMNYALMRTDFHKKIISKFLTCDYEKIESSEGQTRHSLACRSLDGGDSTGPNRIVSAGVALVTTGVSFLLFMGMITLLNPLIAVGVIVLTAINYFAIRAGRLFDEKHRVANAELEKKQGYVENACRSYGGAKDLLLYGVKPWFLSIRDNLVVQYKRIQTLIANRQFVLGFVALTTNLVRDIGAVIYVIYRFRQEDISTGEVVMYMGLIASFSMLLNKVILEFNRLSEGNKQMNDMREFLEFSNDPPIVNPAPLPDLTHSPTVVFKDVTFSYDGETNVLENFNLTIQPGQRLALVGVNGAGKTTLVKLLCGFYKPTTGTIEVGGVDVTRYSFDDYMSFFSAVFQDITTYPITVAENVSFKVLEETDLKRVEYCLDKSGLLPELDKRGGIQAMLGSWRSVEGINLSGGQMQKLLMARALYKEAPILILDEPTAALDPIAESAVYETFNELFGGKTSLFISHRLASTRFCDTIIFLKDGTISEMGTHDELIASGGDYAHMFEVQSHYYKEGGEQIA